MSNELEALKEDYKKLLVQVQAELVQKERYMIQLASTDLLLKMANKKNAMLETALRAASEQYECLMTDTRREL